MSDTRTPTTGDAAGAIKSVSSFGGEQLLITQTAHKNQAEISAKSRIRDAQLAAKIDNIIAQAEQQTKYALADHRLMYGMAERESRSVRAVLSSRLVLTALR